MVAGTVQGLKGGEPNTRRTRPKMGSSDCDSCGPRTTATRCSRRASSLIHSITCVDSKNLRTSVHAIKQAPGDAFRLPLARLIRTMKTTLLLKSRLTPLLPSPRVLSALGALLLLGGASLRLQAAASNSVARVWNERALGAIRVDTPHPPAQARNLFSFSVCMYDAWAAYDAVAVGYVYRGKHTAPDPATARKEAISYAVYRLMRERHVYSRTAVNTLAADDAQMLTLGFDPTNQTRDLATPAGVGNSVYDAVSAWFINDGSRQTNGTPYPLANPPVAYPDYPVGQDGYVYLNPPLATDRAGIDDGFGHTVVDCNRWQRLQIVNSVDQNGFPQGPIQNYLGAHWLGVRPFALFRTDPMQPWIHPGVPPSLGGAQDAQFRSDLVAVLRASSELSADDGIWVNISPGVFGNNTLGANDGSGHATNPATGLPYAPNVVKRGDFTRVLAEFWADGPSSETPPGHWNTLANAVSDHPDFVKRISGMGPVLDDLEWDVKLYFALNAAVHDAACTAWSLKRYYDGCRPLSAIRYLASKGQASDPGLPSYHTNGLPLITNLIELVTTNSVASGRHAGLTPGKLAVLAWPGQPANPLTQTSGVRWIHGEAWVPYQRANFVTPAFPGYTSGHSTFSRSAAEVLTALTGSQFFPGGMATYTAPANTGLGFERGPSQAITLQWATYYDAADQAGLSRIWGGIHPPADDFGGRRSGAECGQGVWALVRRYWDGSVTHTPLTITRVSPTQYEVRYQTLRGLHYQLQTTTELGTPFTNDVPAVSQPFEALSVARTNAFAGPSQFHRVVGRLSP